MSMSLLYFRHTDTHAHTHAQTHKVDTDTQSPAPLHAEKPNAAGEKKSSTTLGCSFQGLVA